MSTTSAPDLTIARGTSTVFEWAGPTARARASPDIPFAARNASTKAREACESPPSTSSARSRSACARSPARAAPDQCVKERTAAFSSSAAPIATAAAVAEPPAGTGRSDARPFSSVLSRPTSRSVVADLQPALGDELAQLFVDTRVDARVRILGQDLFPSVGRDHVSGLGTHPVPTVVVLC